MEDLLGGAKRVDVCVWIPNVVPVILPKWMERVTNKKIKHKQNDTCAHVVTRAILPTRLRMSIEGNKPKLVLVAVTLKERMHDGKRQSLITFKFNSNAQEEDELGDVARRVFDYMIGAVWYRVRLFQFKESGALVFDRRGPPSLPGTYSQPNTLGLCYLEN